MPVPTARISNFLNAERLRRQRNFGYNDGDT
jgi:hypothetical protein